MRPLATLTFLAACLLVMSVGVSDAQAGIIVTVGDSPLYKSSWYERNFGRAPCGEDTTTPAESTESRTTRYDRGDVRQADLTRTCHVSTTGAPRPCPLPRRAEVDPQSGLPSEWRCYAIDEGVYYCDIPIFSGSGIRRAMGDDDEDEDELEVLGCSGASSQGGLSLILGLLGISLLAGRRLRAR